MEWPTTVALAALTALLFAATPPEPQQPRAVEGGERTAERESSPDQGQGTATAPTLPLRTTPAAAIQADHKEPSLAVRKDDAENGESFFDILNSVVTLVTAIAVAFATWRMMRFNQQLVGITRDMHEATAASARATERSAEVAVDSLGIAETALRADRPYLLVRVATIPGYPSGVPGVAWDYLQFLISPHVAIHTENFGKGVALIRRINATLELGERARADGDYTQCVPQPIMVHAIGAGEPVNFPILSRYIRHISDSQRADLEAGRLILFAYGVISYQDILGRNFETGFCWQFAVAGFVQLVEDSDAAPLPLNLRRGPDSQNWNT